MVLGCSGGDGGDALLTIPLAVVCVVIMQFFLLKSSPNQIVY